MLHRPASPKILSLLALFFSRNERAISGVAAVEFALIGGMLALLLVVGTDLGFVAFSDMQVETAAQSGAEYAAVHGFNATSISTAVTAATSASGISASPQPTSFCGCASGATVSTATCGSVCSDGTSAGTYVQVTATRSYSTLLSYPTLPRTFQQTSVATVRIR